MAKILYVEDELVIAELVQRRLLRRGVAVVLAANAVDGMAKAITDRPDVIILDIDLGATSEDGWALVRRLKDAPETRGIPVIALTAQSHRAKDRDFAKQLGFAEYLTKPISFDQLYTTIDRLVSKVSV